MRSYLPNAQFFFGLMFVLALTCNVHAKDKIPETVLTILTKAEAAFDEAATKDEKYAIISKKLNSDYRRNKIELPLEFTSFETNADGYNDNALALAIASANVNLTQKFLAIVDDINAEELWAWGYRQFFTLAHIALDPNLYGCENLDYANRFEILKLLSDKTLDFNITPITEIYKYPALMAGDLQGHVNRNQMLTMQSLGLLFGCNPANKKAEFDIEKLKDTNSIVFKTMIEFGLKKNGPGFTKLHPEAKSPFIQGYTVYKRQLEDAWGF
jgi:hypothetical protein